MTTRAGDRLLQGTEPRPIYAGLPSRLKPIRTPSLDGPSGSFSMSNRFQLIALENLLKNIKFILGYLQFNLKNLKSVK